MKILPPEIVSAIQKIVDAEKVAIIGFVAPQDAVRVSPVSFASAAIEEGDMYRLEEIVNEIKNQENPPDTLHFIIQTPGGELYTSYKIAYFLRNSFKKIKAYVPYQAASGGTLFCCAANEVYLGDLGNLTPIDPQVRYNNTILSAYAFERCVDTLQTIFGEKTPGEVPTPWQQMAEKIDPILYDEMQTAVWNTLLYAKELLLKSNYSENVAQRIVARLARPQESHAHPILFEAARKIGLNVCENDDTIKIYSKYVSQRLKEKSTSHIIECFLPLIKKDDESKPTANNSIRSEEKPIRGEGQENI